VYLAHSPFQDSTDPDSGLSHSVRPGTTPSLPAHPAVLPLLSRSFSDAKPISPEHGSNASWLSAYANTQGSRRARRLRGYPIRCICWCRPAFVRIASTRLRPMPWWVITCCAVLVPVAPPGSISAQKPAFTVSRHAKQLPTPKSDHPRRSVSGFVIRTQPRGCKGVGHTRKFHRAPVRCPASELSALRSIFTNRPPIGLVSRCPVSSLSDTVHLIWLKKKPVQSPAWTAGLAGTLRKEESEVICAAQMAAGSMRRGRG